MLLNSLPKSFEQFEVSILTRKEIPKLNELRLKIEEEVDRQQRVEGADQVTDPVVAPEVFAAHKQHWKKGNRNGNNNYRPKKGKCYKCGGTGHWQNECRAHK